MRRLAAALFLLTVACTGRGTTAVPEQAALATRAPTVAPRPTPIPTPTPVPTPDGSGFDLERAMTDVRVLAVDIGNREAGTGGDAEAAGYLASELEEAGLVAERRPFPLPQGGESWNVVGTPVGIDVERDRYLLVGGHYDSLRGPGANDNASGTAAALEVVRVLSRRAAALPVVFVAFGAEESQPAPGRSHHIGSQAYVAAMSAAARENLVALVNLDMIGHGDTIICGRLSVGPREATERLLRIASELGIAAREQETPDWSDNGPFLKAGLNAGWLWTGDRPEKHTPGDTIDTVRPADVERVGRLALATLRSYR